MEWNVVVKLVSLPKLSDLWEGTWSLWVLLFISGLLHRCAELKVLLKGVARLETDHWSLPERLCTSSVLLAIRNSFVPPRPYTMRHPFQNQKLWNETFETMSQDKTFLS